MWAFPVPVAIVACFFLQKKISEVLATKFLIEPILSFKAEKFGVLKDYITSADLENENMSTEEVMNKLRAYVLYDYEATEFAQEAVEGKTFSLYDGIFASVISSRAIYLAMQNKNKSSESGCSSCSSCGGCGGCGG